LKLKKICLPLDVCFFVGDVIIGARLRALLAEITWL